MQTLSSYLQGAWRAGEGEGVALYDPAAGVVVARTSTAGLDLEAALSHARAVGGPALRAMSFAERGAALAQLSRAIHARREALIEMGRLNGGNTRGDAKFDIDGCTGTLMYYAGLGAELGDRGHLLDSTATPLGRSARVAGQHLMVPRSGVAVHINAFNFPAWGLGEKLACAILAGMPVLSKPGTSTALLAWGVAQAVVDSGALPEGAFSFLCGGVGDLLDHLRWDDVVAFTGGAETGARVRGHRQVVAAGVRVNVEADSLNAAVLGPAAEEATYDAFIRHVHQEMTQKVGQKCTAVRRVLVPADRVDEVIEDLGERLASSVVGDPAEASVSVGPLASRAQWESARAGLAALREVAEVVWGDPELGAADGGCFLAPVLLRAREPLAAGPIHALEVFGPVATILAYDGTAAQAVRLVRMGGGSLVASVYGDDRVFLKESILGLASGHGRLAVTDAKIADKALAPGVVLPQLVHGGPGRAGGGEELGGVRGLGLYQQRCAVQGNGPLIARLLA